VSRAESTTTEQGVSVAAYARLRGVSHTAVQDRIILGALPTSTKRIRGKWRIIDVDQANEEWEKNTRPKSDANGRTSSSALANAAVRERLARAELLELRNAQQLGHLVPAREVEQRWAALVVTARTALLGLPSRARGRLPHLTATDVAVLDGLIREALAELAPPMAAQATP
jgi:phage terminase Nu1 subunit (DNA packaging protein)